MMPPEPSFSMDIPQDSNGSGHSPSAGYNFQTNGSPIPWAEIFSRHETVLNSHLEMLDSVKGHVAPEGEAFRAVSSMVNKTIQAMNQFKVVRKHMMNKKAFDNPSHSSASAPKMSARPTSTPHSTDTDTCSRKKRSHTQKEGDTASTTSELYTHSDSSEGARASKRKRDTGSYSGVDEEQYNLSGTTETEDISEEVQRRLRIKEEMRRMKENSQLEKRKRESLLSNESTSPGAPRPRKKRAKTGNELKRGVPVPEMEPDVKSKKLKKSRG